MTKRKGLSEFILLVSVLAFSACAATTENTNPREAARYGEAVYSLYLDDPLTSLSVMAKLKTQGLNEQHLASVTLLEGGLALGYGMPQLAERNLTQSPSGQYHDPLAFYWLARLNFSQNRLREGLEAYQSFISVVEQTDADIDEILTLPQWYELNYQSAQASAQLTPDGYAAYEMAIPENHITRQYLSYNQAVDAFSNDSADTALAMFNQIEATLSAQQQDTSASSFLSGWWTAAKDQTVSQTEIEGLLNQVYLSHGQVLLAEGRFTDALTVFGKISGQSLVRDEALLQYGWGLARRDDWPLAMGVWDFLSAQAVNLYTLQAGHALALGYAREGGEVQAYNSLEQLVNKLTETVDSLDALHHNVETAGFWLALAKQVNGLSSEVTEEQSGWSALWPAAHQDLLIEMMLSDTTQQDQLAQLEELYALQNQLEARLTSLNTYTQLLNERDLAHQKRATEYRDNPTEARLLALQKRASALNQTLTNTHTLLSQSNDTAYFKGLQTYANQAHLDWLARLERANVRLTRLSAERRMRATYTERLSRLKGILLWDLSEHSVSGDWALRKGLNETQALLKQAQTRQEQFNALVSTANITAPQRTRVIDLIARVNENLTRTKVLIGSLEQQLTQQAQQAMQSRRYYLVQQQNLSKLALLQLQDRWRADETHTPSGQGVPAPSEQMDE